MSCKIENVVLYLGNVKKEIKNSPRKNRFFCFAQGIFSSLRISYAKWSKSELKGCKRKRGFTPCCSSWTNGVGKRDPSDHYNKSVESILFRVVVYYVSYLLNMTVAALHGPVTVP